MAKASHITNTLLTSNNIGKLLFVMDWVVYEGGFNFYAFCADNLFAL